MPGWYKKAGGSCSGVLAIATTFLLSLCVTADEPLHVQIDKLIDQQRIGPETPLASDAEFLRRVYLDLAGTIPSSAEARKFIDDKSPTKRAELVDRLLADERYIRHMAGVLDVMLMERRPDKHVKAPQWQEYLLTSVRENKPYNQLAAEILGADGVDEKKRAAVKFYLDREVEANLLTREVGRMFFGMDLECAQCHNHPLVDDYMQSDYYGIYAFLQRGYLFQPDKKKPAVFAEKPTGNATFKSVFTGDEGETRPRLPGGSQVDEPTFATGEEYKVKPDPKKKTIQPIPKYSRRAQLAKLATNGSNAWFNRNIVNRLWAHMMGRGIVHPVDMHHSDNPPSHPQLLDALAKEIVVMKFDVKSFLREIALSESYQRSCELPADLEKHVEATKQQLAAIESTVKALEEQCTKTAQVVADRTGEVEAAREAIAPLDDQLKKATAAVAPAEKALGEAKKAYAPIPVQLREKGRIAKTVAEAATKSAEAAKSLPTDKEINDAAAKIQERSKQLAGEVAALSKTESEKSAVLRSATEKLNVAKKSVDDITAKVAEAKRQVDQKKAEVEVARAELIAQRTEAESANLRIFAINALLDYSTKAVSVTTAKATINSANSEIAKSRSTLDQATKGLKKFQADLVVAQKAHQDATKVLTTVTAKLAEKQLLAKTVAEAHAKAEEARQKLPQDQVLVAAAGTFKARSEQLASEVAAIGKSVKDQQTAVNAAAGRVDVAKRGIDRSMASVKQLTARIQSLDAQLKQATETVKTNSAALDAAYQQITDKWAHRFAIAQVKQLTAEQMAWSVLQATGAYDRQRIAEASAINKKTPLKPEEQKNAAKVAAREKEIDLATYNKLKATVAKFVKLFAAAPGNPQDDFFATVDQALFFRNGGETRGWLAPSGGNLTDRLNKMDDPKLIAEEMYLSVLTRRPTVEELADVSQYIASRPKEKLAVVQEMVWALLTSTEFRFHH